MKKKRCTSASSTSTEASQHKNVHDGRRKLLKHSWVQCEFCDKSFSNKFELMKHNVTHIIIPLIKQTTYECEECLHHFTSIEDLAMHISKKHDLACSNPLKITLNEQIHDKLPEILQSIVEKQVLVKCEDGLKDVFVKASELKTNGFIRNENIVDNHIVHSNSLKPKPIILIDPLCLKPDPITMKPNPIVLKPEAISLKPEAISLKPEAISLKPEAISLKPEPISLKEESVSSRDVISIQDSSEDEEEPIRHRLLFEEDIEENLFKDLTTDCKVNIESLFQDATIDVPSDEINLELFDFDRSSSGLDFTSNTGYRRDSMYEDRIYKVQEDNVHEVHEDTTDLLRYGKAIHYDVLMEDELCTCKWCGHTYPNRFELLKHEAKHILLKQKQWRTPLCCVCERYIAGNYHNLRRHMEQNHPEKVELEITFATHKCMKCHHQYHNYMKHLRHYHEYYKCGTCLTGFDSPKLLENHECGKVVTKIELDDGSNKPNGVADITRSYKDSIEFRPEPIKSSCRITSSVMQLCEMCYSFMNIYMQNRNNYELIGEKNELGVRQICDKCNNLFFEVKLVKRKTIRDPSKEMRPRMKHLSNKDRLKKMQNRLKMINKLNKF